MNNAKYQKWQELLDIEFFRLFPFGDLELHLGVVDFDVMVYNS